MADNQEEEKPEQTTPSDAVEEAEDTPQAEAEPVAAEAEAAPEIVADPVEDTYESVAAPPDTAADEVQPEPEKSNGTAAAESIEVPLDENEAAAQPLTGEKDVEGGAVAAEEGAKSPVRIHERLLRSLRKREILFPLIGGITFLLGLILIITALLIMQGKCDRQTTMGGSTDGPSVALGSNGEEDSHLRYTDNMHTHDNNGTSEDGGSENLAEGHPAFQSSTFSNKGVLYNASLAVDGYTGGRLMRGECAQTERQSQPYWNVDLEAEQLVGRVKIIIPSDCCMGEIHDFKVHVGSSEDLMANPVCKHFMGTALSPSINMLCDQALTGRYVSIHMLGDNTRTRDRLNLCEVMVYSR